MNQTSPTTQVVRIPRGWRITAVALTVLFGLASAGTLLLLADGGKWVLFAIVAFCCGLMELVFARMAGVRLAIEPDRLVVRNVFRTHRLRRKDIDEFDLGPSANPFGSLRTIVVRAGDREVRIESFAMPSVEEHLLEPVLDQFHEWRFPRR